MTLRFVNHIVVFLIFISISASRITGQSLSSLTGLFNIPSAETIEDGEIALGIYTLPKYYVEGKHFDNWALNYYFSIGFLPFVEGSIRFTRDYSERDALGDRMFSLKIKPIEENEYVPSIAIGLQDFFHSTVNRTNRFSSVYIAVTKNVHLKSLINNISFNLGRGFDWIEAGGYEYIGFFGGVSITFFNFMELIGEYDALEFNSALRIKLFNHLQLMGGFINMKYFSGGGSIFINL